MRVFAAIIVSIGILSPGMHAQDRSHARSMVITRYGIVATSYTLASQAGAQVLARGGSAVDAAIAANAVLGVAEPMVWNCCDPPVFWPENENRIEGNACTGKGYMATPF